MAFSSIPITDLLTDAVAAFTNATWVKLRNNIDSHTHITGQGKTIPSGGITNNILTGAKFTDGVITRKKQAHTIYRATSYADVGTATGYDTAVEIAINPPVDSRLMILYRNYEKPVVGSTSSLELRIRVDGAYDSSVNIALGIPRNDEMYEEFGFSVMWWINVTAGAHTITPAITNVGTFKSPRELLIVEMGQ